MKLIIITILNILIIIIVGNDAIWYLTQTSQAKCKENLKNCLSRISVCVCIDGSCMHLKLME